MVSKLQKRTRPHTVVVSSENHKPWLASVALPVAQLIVVPLLVAYGTTWVTLKQLESDEAAEKQRRELELFKAISNGLTGTDRRQICSSVWLASALRNTNNAGFLDDIHNNYQGLCLLNANGTWDKTGLLEAASPATESVEDESASCKSSKVTETVPPNGSPASKTQPTPPRCPNRDSVRKQIEAGLKARRETRTASHTCTNGAIVGSKNCGCRSTSPPSPDWELDKVEKGNRTSDGAKVCLTAGAGSKKRGTAVSVYRLKAQAIARLAKEEVSQRCD